MRVVRYSCDGGSLAIGSEHARVCLPNNIGDGTYSVYITGIDESLAEVGNGLDNRNNWDFVGAVEGDEIKLFAYDCYHTAAEAIRNVIITLSGRFGIFCLKSDGIFWLQEWD